MRVGEEIGMESRVRTWIHPLHAVWEAVSIGVLVVVHSHRARRDTRIMVCDCAIGVDVVASPGWVQEHCVCCGK